MGQLPEITLQERAQTLGTIHNLDRERVFVLDGASNTLSIVGDECDGPVAADDELARVSDLTNEGATRSGASDSCQLRAKPSASIIYSMAFAAASAFPVDSLTIRPGCRLPEPQAPSG